MDGEHKDVFELKAKIIPGNATEQAVTWTSSDEGVATVDRNGRVTAVAAGEAVVTVTTKDGGHQATCRVTVVEQPPSSTCTWRWMT